MLPFIYTLAQADFLCGFELTLKEPVKIEDFAQFKEMLARPTAVEY